MSLDGELLEHARCVKRGYMKPNVGMFFAGIDERISANPESRIPRYLPKVFQYILDDFSSLDDFSRTDFLSCLLRLGHRLPKEKRIMDLRNIESHLDTLLSWDVEIAQEILSLFSDD